jgi:hypothetical protein
MTTLHEINLKAQSILRTSLGPVDYVRYTQQFSAGSGDYTAERQRKPEENTADVAKRVAAMKADGVLQSPANARVVE